MSHRVIEVYANEESRKAVVTAIENSKPVGFWETHCIDNRIHYSVLVKTESTQNLTDKLQSILGHNSAARIIIMPVEATLPKPEEEKSPKRKNALAKSGVKGGASGASISREELYDDVAKSASYDKNFVFLVIFSTIVAAIGLIENNVAVVIGAMVIAPLLGPNLALALATTLGDVALMGKAIRTNLVGVAISVTISIIIGAFWPGPLNSNELMIRTDVGFDGITLALTSGAAAVLSLTTGLPSVLVGVMVAVALLPPAATMGIMLGAGNLHLAFGALLLLVVNVVCINLSAKLVFLYQGIKPRTWHEKKVAIRSMFIYLISWAVALLVLSAAIYIRGGVDF